MEKMLPFEMDSEYANFAASAIPDMKKMNKRVDIRVLKKLKRLQDLENRPLKEKLNEGKQSIVNHLFDKLNPTEETLPSQLLKSQVNSKKSKDDLDKENANKENHDQKDTIDEDTDSNLQEAMDKAPVHNSWSDENSKGHMPIDMTDDRPIVTEDFKQVTAVFFVKTIAYIFSNDFTEKFFFSYFFSLWSRRNKPMPYQELMYVML